MSVTSLVCLCPEGPWSPLTSTLNLRTLQILSEYISFHHCLGRYRSLSPFFPQIRKGPPLSEIWHRDLKFLWTKKRSAISSSLHSLSHIVPSISSASGSLSGTITQHCEYINSSHLLRKVFPNGLSLRNGLLGSTIRAFPGITPSTSPCMMAVKQSVVGSGPILLPGISCSSRYLSATHTHTLRFLSVLNSAITYNLTVYTCLMQSCNVLLDESCLSSGVLSHHQHHRLVIKVCILQTGRVEVMETIELLQRQQLLTIQGLEPFCHSADHLRCLFHIFSPPARHFDWLTAR